MIFVLSVGVFVDCFEYDMVVYIGVKCIVVCVSGINVFYMVMLLVGVECDDEVFI